MSTVKQIQLWANYYQKNPHHVTYLYWKPNNRADFHNNIYHIEDHRTHSWQPLR
jgi:hypothetical protein